MQTPTGWLAATMRRSGGPLSVPDSLYGTVSVSGWATALLTTPPFARLAGVSLSSVPGELLFGHEFPSRLDHAIGVYYLARLARPRDRALQLAALAHDLGHGPFSHLCEPLMLERLGKDHESRSVSLLQAVREALPESASRRLDWLDWDEVAGLMRGERRGVLLAGSLDYDNADNVARFKLHAGFGEPGYDPRRLARGLRLAPASVATVGLLETVEPDGLAWQQDRLRVYRFLHGDDGGHRNLALHAMLRKALDLAVTTEIVPDNFFDLTDCQALSALRRGLDRGLLALVDRVEWRSDRLHQCVWEAEAEGADPEIRSLFDRTGKRLAFEAELAAEARLAPHEVILDALVSNAVRALPPIWPASGRPGERNGPIEADPAPELPAPPRVLHLFIGAGYGTDYVWRLRQAADRLMARLGVRLRVRAG